jgi:uncharacterized protein YbjQ (UPF0145 family)
LGFRLEFRGTEPGSSVNYSRRAPARAGQQRGAVASIGGGNITAYEQVCEETRAQAFERMLAHAAEVRADAVLAMRYDATEFSHGITEVLAYGTAVALAPDEPRG